MRVCKSLPFREVEKDCTGVCCLQLLGRLKPIAMRVCKSLPFREVEKDCTGVCCHGAQWLQLLGRLKPDAADQVTYVTLATKTFLSLLLFLGSETTLKQLYFESSL